MAGAGAWESAPTGAVSGRRLRSSSTAVSQRRRRKPSAADRSKRLTRWHFTRTLGFHPEDPPGAKLSGKQIKFLVSGALVVVALIVWFAVVTGGASTSQAAYDISLKQFHAQSSQESGDDVRVHGKVEEGSIVQKAGSADVSFTLVDEGETLQVRYSTKNHGPIPDTFVDGANAIVTGSLDDSGVFQAHTLQAKCPSKYEGAKTETASK
jgi:cytochrome c-type biogenesis protein CcmE